MRHLATQKVTLTHQKECIIQPKTLQERIDGNIQRWVNWAPYGCICCPFPGKVAVPKNDAVRDFKRLEEFVRLEECAGADCSE